MNTLLQDIRYALRGFLRQPGLTLVAVLSLGFGIGATATVFTWLEGTVLNPLPAIPDWQRVVVAHTRAPEGGLWSASWPEVTDWRAGVQSADLAGWEIVQVGLRDGTESAERAWGQIVSGNYFEVLQVGAALGRVLGPEDEARRLPVAVLGHRYWRQRFRGDSSVVGRAISLNGAAFTIVGVAPERFVGNYIGLDLNLYLPITTLPLLRRDGGSVLEDRQQRMFEVIGRLRPGLSMAQATAELDAVARRSATAAGMAQPLGALLRWHGSIDAPGALRPLFGALLAVAGLVLLIACANVANLLLARAMARRREIAVRLAVGASRRRLIRQLLTESLALAALAGTLGVVLSFWGRDAFMAVLPAVPYPIGLDFHLDGSVVVFATAVTALTAMAFGLVPAVQASRPDLVPTLKDEIGEGIQGRGRLQGALVVVQVALALVTLVTAGLFVRSLRHVQSQDSGMANTDHILVVGTDLSLTGIKGDSLSVSVVRRLLERVRALPGVEAAAIARAIPLGASALNSSVVQIEGYAPRPTESMTISHNVVSDDYFRTSGIALLDGRTFGDADLAGNAPVVVVNEAFARRFFGDRSPLGARLTLAGSDPLSVVGVVATSKYNDYTEDPLPLVFRPYSARSAPAGFTLHVLTTRDPMALAAGVRSAFAEVSADLPFLEARYMAEATSIPYFPQKVGATMLAAVGVLALLLATVGIYATVAYGVSRRVREIGVRIALGAARRDVVKLVVGRGMQLTGLGLVIGLAGAVLVGFAVRSQLLGVSPYDPVTFAGVGLLLAAVALAACLLPARRAARVDPMVALRSE